MIPILPKRMKANSQLSFLTLTMQHYFTKEDES